MDARYGYDVRTEIVGTKGTIRVGSVHNTPVEFLTKPGKREDTVNHFLVRFADAYVAEMRDFVETILSDRAPRITSDDGRQALAVVMAAVRSFKESRPVPVSAPKPIGVGAPHLQKTRRSR
jgi:predicted dehydrogenase